MKERIEQLLNELELLDPTFALAIREDLKTTACTSEQMEDLLVAAIERRKS